MKKIIRMVLVSCMILSLLIPNVAFAASGEIQEDWQDIILSEEEFEEVLSNNPSNEIQPLAAGLIDSYSIGIAKDGNTLIIAGKTSGSTDVKKCGFSEVIIQRRANSSSSWANYLTYKDLYIDARIYALTKRINMPSGYQYRVKCTHYAKKNIFSVEKIDNVSNTVTL